jgi:hypothetical protein
VLLNSGSCSGSSDYTETNAGGDVDAESGARAGQRRKKGLLEDLGTFWRQKRGARFTPLMMSGDSSPSLQQQSGTSTSTVVRGTG